MALRKLSVTAAVALAIALACGGSEDGEGGSGGSGASAGADGDGSAGSSAGGSAGSSAGSSAGGSAGSSAGGAAGSSAGGSAGSSAGGAAGSSAGGSAGSAATGGAGPCTVILCQGQMHACGDCQDNDGDNLVDMADPDCLGPCHNSESVYHNCIPGGGAAPCKADCYFDKDTGPGTPPGNDGCYWNHECDPLSVAPSFDPEGPACPYNPGANTPGTNKSCQELLDPGGQTQACLDFCQPLTPNGCDCFGCCELPAGSGKFVWLGSTSDDSGRCSQATCTVDTADDPTKCRPCTPVKSCVNTCERCELCLGKDTLPPDCFPPPDGGAGAGGTGGTTGGTGGTTAGTGGTTGGTGGTGGTTGGTGGTTGGSGGTGGSCPKPLCPPGVQSCGLSCLPSCPTGQFCLTGCCINVPQ